MSADVPPKGYWIGHLDVTNPDVHQTYIAASSNAIAAFGGRFLVRGGEYSQVEGSCRTRQIVIEFESYQRAIDCYHSHQYTSARALRANTATADIVIVEGAT